MDGSILSRLSVPQPVEGKQLTDSTPVSPKGSLCTGGEWGGRGPGQEKGGTERCWGADSSEERKGRPAGDGTLRAGGGSQDRDVSHQGFLEDGTG